MSEHRSDRENKVSLYERGGQLMSDEPLYLTADGRVVPEGDPAAQQRLATPGLPIRPKDAERYGLKATGKGAAPPKEEKSPEPAPTPEAEAEETEEKPGRSKK